MVHIGSAPSQWQDYLAAPGTANATRARNDFIAQVTAICGGADKLQLGWAPVGTETTTVTSFDKAGRIFTEANTIQGRLSALGSGWAVSYNGSSDYATTPDIDALTAGDSKHDFPFSLVALVNVTDTAANRPLISKNGANAATTVGAQSEYGLVMDTGDVLRWQVRDASASGSLRVFGGTQPTQGSWSLVTATYDGSRSGYGMGLYINKTAQTVTVAETTYTAMENGTSALALGQCGSAVASNYFQGSYALLLWVRRCLLAEDVAALTYAVDGYFNLSL